MGGLGLFLDPGGRPLGLRDPISTAPSLGSSWSLSSSPPLLLPLLFSLMEISSSRCLLSAAELVAAESMPGSPKLPLHQGLARVAIVDQIEGIVTRKREINKKSI